MKYINKTIYTKEVYKRISYQKSFSYELLSFKGMLMAAILWFGARLVKQDNTQLGAWIICGFGGIFIPFVFFIYPIIKPKFTYKQSLKVADGKELVNEITLDKSEIIARNNVGQKIMVSYDLVTEIRKTKYLIILLSNKFDPIYMDINGFINCKVEDALDYLYSKCEHLNKKQINK